MVSVLSKDSVQKYYRFYGARHSIINLGFCIDYDIQDDDVFLPKLRNISHRYDSWMLDNNKLYYWQFFIRFLFSHLKDVSIADEFYFNLLDEMVNNFFTQNPKRVILESLLKLFEFEGSLSHPLICVKCSNEIKDRVTFANNLTPFHTHCISQKKYFDVQDLEYYFTNKNTFLLDNKQIDTLFSLAFYL